VLPARVDAKRVPGALPRFHPAFGRLSGPALPGGLDTVASLHGSRPIGKKILGAVSVSFFVTGALMFGSSPRWRT